MVPEIEPDRVLDDLGREAMAAVAERSHADILPDTPLAPDPVSVTMPSVEMAGDRVLRGDLLADGRLVGAARHGMRTARMKPAPGRRIERARDLAGNRQPFVPLVGMGRQGGGKQRLRIGMERLSA